MSLDKHPDRCPKILGRCPLHTAQISYEQNKTLHYCDHADNHHLGHELPEHCPQKAEREKPKLHTTLPDGEHCVAMLTYNKVVLIATNKAVYQLVEGTGFEAIPFRLEE